MRGDDWDAAFTQGVLEGEEINPRQFRGTHAPNQAARVQGASQFNPDLAGAATEAWWRALKSRVLWESKP